MMSYWNLGQGAALKFASKFPAGVPIWARNWQYFPQAMMYLVYRISEKELPRDPDLFQIVMNTFISFRERNRMLDSLVSWVENFGGNTVDLRNRIEDLDTVMDDAYEDYLQADMDGALEDLDRGREEQMAIREAASSAKDRALAWVYMIEWFSLIATFMISGFVLWTLMVRRRLYREVGTSKLRSE